MDIYISLSAHMDPMVLLGLDIRTRRCIFLLEPPRAMGGCLRHRKEATLLASRQLLWMILMRVAYLRSAQHHPQPYAPQPPKRAKQGFIKGYLELIWALFCTRTSSRAANTRGQLDQARKNGGTPSPTPQDRSMACPKVQHTGSRLQAWGKPSLLDV